MPMSERVFETVVCERGFDYPKDCDSSLCRERGCHAPLILFSPSREQAMKDWVSYCAQLKRELDRR